MRFAWWSRETATSKCRMAPPRHARGCHRKYANNRSKPCENVRKVGIAVRCDSDRARKESEFHRRKPNSNGAYPFRAHPRFLWMAFLVATGKRSHCRWRSAGVVLSHSRATAKGQSSLPGTAVTPNSGSRKKCDRRKLALTARRRATLVTPT